jgi:hypothetical protein
MSPREWASDVRLAGLRRFALAITVLNVLGHTVLGFEQSWAQPFVALATAYSLQMLIDWFDARANGIQPAFRGLSRVAFVDYLLSPHISGMAVSMLLYANEALLPVMFAAAAAIASKRLFRIRIGMRSRHFLNPSNFGIAATLVLFPWVGIAPPYQFTENLPGLWNWLLPGVIIITGSLINSKFTGRIYVLAGWLVGFVLQALIRHLVFAAPLGPALLPMTGMAFLLYTFYMVTDPPTTPTAPARQLGFGLAVAGTYGLLVTFHIVFGLFFALPIVCAVRGLGIYLAEHLPAATDTATATNSAAVPEDGASQSAKPIA